MPILGISLLPRRLTAPEQVCRCVPRRSEEAWGSTRARDHALGGVKHRFYDPESPIIAPESEPKFQRRVRSRLAPPAVSQERTPPSRSLALSALRSPDCQPAPLRRVPVWIS